MLSIGSMNTYSGAYYIDLATEDYYLGGGEPPGQWCGHGAQALGIAGRVEKEAFYFLLHGLSPDGSIALVQDSAGKPHHPGWDLTFSAPKSVSVFWSQADADVRSTVERIHHASVESALDYIERNAAFTRRGRGGRQRVPVSILAATFEHGTSRAQDPQLHSHALVLNIGRLSDGTTGALDGRNLYRYKMAAGAVYRVELAARLAQELGLEVQRRGNLVELRGVPQPLIREFSKRREVIEQVLNERGAAGARAAAVAALDTRVVKQHIARSELFTQWRAVGQHHAFSTAEATALLRSAASQDPDLARHDALQAAWHRLDDSCPRFTARDLVNAIAVNASPGALRAEDVEEMARDCLHDHSRARPVGTWQGDAVYASAGALDAEAQFSERVLRLASAGSPRTEGRAGVLASSASMVLHPTMSQEQRDAVRAMGHDDRRVRYLDVWAGADRMPVLSAARQSWERQGFTVLGVSPTARGAADITDKAGIHCVTAGLLLRHLDAGLGDYVRYHARQLSRFVQGKRTFAPDEYFARMGAHTVLFIDRSHQFGLQQFDRITREAERTGASLVFVGDSRAPTPLGRGGMFEQIVAQADGVELKVPDRQRLGASREAIRAAAAGDPHRALKAHAESGRCRIASTHAQAADRLLGEWSARASRSPRNNVIYAASAEISELNRRAQLLRLQSGELGSVSVRAEGVDVHRGDRVRLRETNRKLGLYAGSLGTVVAVEPLTRNLIVKLDGGRIVGVPLHVYTGVELGYAVPLDDTVEAAPKNAFVLVDASSRDAGSVYALLSHARAETVIFMDRQTAGADLCEVARLREASSKSAETPDSSQRSSSTNGPSRASAKGRGRSARAVQSRLARPVDAPAAGPLTAHDAFQVEPVAVDLLRRPPGANRRNERLRSEPKRDQDIDRGPER